jgi:tRNA dimethylallyltransferase
MAIRNQQSAISTNRAFDQDQAVASPRKVLVLVGPTASGKTAVSIELAQRLKGEIISADSRQLYKYLDIGTAKPTKEQLATIRHHFVDEFLPNQPFNAGEFGEKGRKAIDDVFERGRTPIVVGGSGLYVQSLIDGFFEGPGANIEVREALERRVAAGDLPRLIEELSEVDPVSAERIDPTKPRRIIRALEVFYGTGKPLSELHQRSRIQINFTSTMFGLEWERKALYERINHRCEEMIRSGLLDEVEKLEKLGYSSSLNSLNTVGYAEVFAYRRGEISYEEMLRLVKQNSRRYAKRQMTWFRRDSRIHWLKQDEHSHPKKTAERIAHLFAASR